MSFRLIVEGTTSMRYRIVEKPEFRIAGKMARVPLVHEGMNPAIVSHIRGMDPDALQELSQLCDQEPHGIIGASVNLADSRAEGTELDYYYGVVTSAAVPANMDCLPVAAGSWAVFESSGAFPQALQYLWRDVFTQWFPSNPYRSRTGPEILRTRLSADGTEADAELWIPVEPS
jgi:AraC family transcriptional regulator